MTEKEAMALRHSVRQYEEKSLDREAVRALTDAIDKINAENGLHIQLVLDEPKAFDSGLAHYGSFSGVTNYFALVGKKEDEEKLGYYGEKLVLLAQTLGLNTCWVALTFKKIKNAFVVDAGEKLLMVISLGYGKTQGVPHKNKPFDKVARAVNPPQWFVDGVNAALNAPTAVNQQKFVFTLKGNNVVAASAGLGFYTVTDLGIAKYHFELGAGKENFSWE